MGVARVGHSEALLIVVFSLFAGLLVSIVFLAHPQAPSVRVPVIISSEYCEVVGLVQLQLLDQFCLECL